MKKHPTLEELVKERGLKPRECEIKHGRYQTKNGYSYVHIDEENKYATYLEENKELRDEVVLVRG